MDVHIPTMDMFTIPDTVSPFGRCNWTAIQFREDRMRIISDKVLAFGKFDKNPYGIENLFSADEQDIVYGIEIPWKSDVDAASKILNSNGYIAKNANTDKPCDYWLNCRERDHYFQGDFVPLIINKSGHVAREYGYKKSGYRPIMWLKL